MGAFEIILGAVLVLASIIIIGTVTLQETKGGLGSLYGGAGDSFFDKNLNRTREATLLRATKFAGICLFAVTILLGFMVAR